MSQISDAILAGNIGELKALGANKGAQQFQFSTEKERWNYLHIALLAVRDLVPADIISYLLEAGVNPNAADCYGNTPLHYAARAKYVDAMKLLLDNGAMVDPVNNDCLTPLRKTLLTKPYSIAATSLLLLRGANPDAKGKSGKTVRDYVRAIAHGDDRAIGELFDLPST